jgi:hypothetical protein
MTKIVKVLVVLMLLVMAVSPIASVIKPANAIPAWSMTPTALPSGSSMAVVLSGNIAGSPIGKVNYNCIGSNQTIDLWFDPALPLVSSTCSIAADGTLTGYFYISPSAAVGLYHGRLQGVPSDFTVQSPVQVITQVTVTQTIPATTTQTQVFFTTTTNTSTQLVTTTSGVMYTVTYTDIQTVKSIIVVSSTATITNTISENVTVTSTNSTIATSTVIVLVQNMVTSTVLVSILAVICIIFITWWRRTRTGGLA